MKMVPLGEVATVDRTIVKPHEIPDDTKYVGLEHITKSGREVHPIAAKVAHVASTKHQFDRNQILYGKLRPYLAKIATPDFDGVCSTDILPLTPSENVDRSYLYYFLSQTKKVHEVSKQATGANLPRIKPATLENLLLPLPPLDEQRRIAAILDKADAIRQKRRQTIAHLDTLTQSIFHESFGRHDSDIWPRQKIGAVGEVLLGRQRAPKFQTGKWSRPYMRVANIKLNKIDLDDVLSMDFDDKDFKTYRLAHGDILLNEGQSTELVGRPAMWRNEIPDCCFQNTLLRFRPNREIVVPEYMLMLFIHLMKSGIFSRISSKTSNVAHLGKNRFSNLDIPVPPVKTQKQFADSYCSLMQHRETAVSMFESTGELFKSLQSRAFRGEL